MFTVTVQQVGLDTLRTRLELARQQVQPLVQQAVMDAGNTVKQALSEAAPHGKGDGTPVGDDEPGHIADSFYVQEESAPGDAGAACSVRTTQPNKVQLLLSGTGLYGDRGERIVPTTKRALFWPGAEHPVRSVAGMKANDFVTPALDDAPDAESVLGTVIDELNAILEGA